MCLLSSFYLLIHSAVLFINGNEELPRRETASFIEVVVQFGAFHDEFNVHLCVATLHPETLRAIMYSITAAPKKTPHQWIQSQYQYALNIQPIMT